MELNREQGKVLEKGFDDAAKVMAGAGTGKTRVLVALYLKYLLQDRISPDRLLALTFTNKAAAEMKKRIFERVKAVGDEVLLRGLYSAWIMNFHSFGRRVLSGSSPSFGLDPSLDVAGPVDTARIEQLLLRKYEAGRLPGMPGDLGEDVPSPKNIRSRFERCLKIVHKCRSMLMKPEDLLAAVREDDHADYKNFTATVVAVWNAYNAELRRRKLVDFDDMIEQVVEGFKNNPLVREIYTNQFDQILVDEFQDTSEAQNELLRLLCGGDFQKITVVGDEKQSIYRWRDARVENIRSFPGRAYVLKQNYRSPQGILDLAHRFICKDDYFAGKRDEIRLEAEEQQEGAPLVVFHPEEEDGRSSEMEAKALAAWIRHLTEGIPVEGMSPLIVPKKGREPIEHEDIAILLRSLRDGSGLKEYENALRMHDIPYAVVGGTNALEANALRTLLALLSAVVFPEDTHSLLIVLEAMPFSINDAALAELFVAARKAAGTAKGERDEAASDVAEELSADLLLSPDVLSVLSDDEARRRCELLRRFIDSLRMKNAKRDLRTFMIEALEESSFFYQLFEDGASREIARNLSLELLSEAERLSQRNDATLAAFIDRVRRMIDERELGEASEALLPPKRVRIMTIHQAKGLEFPAVAVAGMKLPKSGRDDYFVSKARGLFLSDGDEWGRGLEHLDERDEELSTLDQEERCLRYVAMTRAKEYLFVSSPYPEGRSGKQSTLFADVLDCLREGGIEFCELRRAPELPVPAFSPSRVVDGDPLGAAVEAATDWISSRKAVEAVREDLPGKHPPVRFVNWRALKAFGDCPLQYYYRSVAGIGEELAGLGEGDVSSNEMEEKGETIPSEVAPKGVDPAAYGIFMHGILEDVMRLPREERAVSLDLLEGRFSRSGMPEKLRARVVETAAKSVQSFLQSSLAEAEWIECLETPFHFRLGRIIFRGVLDRVDRTDGGFRVVDYKAGAEHEDYEFQVRFYAWALDKILGGKKVEGVLAFLGDEVRAHEVDTGPRSLRALDTAAERLEMAAASNRYDPKPGEVCRECAYSEFCPHAVKFVGRVE
ncbi:MAG: UvrD-helicase domain-containing protein [Candidatus Latescibacteria bacterium]|nr:UvrD-helicase domain-containing protein [Candidatus Latescibacterota bacterium]NIM22522.1 UvrD-helicase domain-containing protein [Candidatus Latescibacterota bacterium]NIM64836.1 UvrD-helicase domain-containing protein [Candidatus Latescibacterota bacterium]NIO01344.1 UvrD-helicase domain-containing protein [Candidatus Latescibacterota bacterium]NIO27833.1 UvrD-helicase domain-containing protein [Candidatus Latescibacterota bacterium]